MKTAKSFVPTSLALCLALSMFGVLANDLLAQALPPVLVSHASGTPTTTANAASSSLGINASSGVTRSTSDDGRYMLVSSGATNLLAGLSDSNGTTDLFLYDRVSDGYTLVSHTPGSTTQTGNGLSGFATMSADAAWVAFSSAATNLVTGITDTNGQHDVFLWERASGNITLCSKSGSSATVTANNRTIGAQISYDGRYVASYTLATDFAPGITDANGCNDIVLYDRVTDTNRVVSHTATSATTTFSPAGTQPDAFRVNMALSSYYLVYICGGTDLVTGQVDTNTFGDLFCYDIASNTNTLITHTASSNTTAATAACYSGAISADGSHILFHHNAGNLISGTDTNNNFDLFLWSRASNTNILVSHVAGQPTTASSSISVGSGPPPLPATYNGVISNDGRYCAYFHGANDLIAGQSGTTNNLFLYDRVTDTTTLVTRQPGSSTVGVGGMASMGGNLDAAMTADGRYLTYVATASSLVTGVTDSNGLGDVFLFDRTSGSNMLLSRTLSSPTTTANGTPSRMSITRNMAMAHFQSGATDMAASDSNAVADVFAFNLGGVVSGATPASCGTAGGVTVTLTGVGFTGVTAVRFGGVTATGLNVASDTQISLTAPAHAAGAVTIELVTSFVTTSFSGLFAYGNFPSLTSVTPGTGVTTGGTSVTLAGSNFTGATSVTFGGTAATNLNVVSDTQITCTTPAHAQGVVSVVVTTANGSNSTNTLFTYVPPAPSISFASASASVGEAAGTLTLTVNLSNAYTTAVTVNYASANGTAASGGDYGAVSGTLTIAASQTSGTITVNIAQDTLDETNETFTVALSSPTNGTLGSPATVTITINDDDAAPTVTLAASTNTVAENSGTLNLTVNLSAVSGLGVTVNYATSNGSATAGSDYTAASGTLTIAAGQASGTIALTILDDTTDEPDQTFTLALSSPGNATLGTPASTTATVTDNDAAPTVQLAAGNINFTEAGASASVSVTLAQASEFSVTVDWAATAGTATAGTDFNTGNGTLTFAPGSTSQSFNVAVLDDAQNEANETIGLALGNAGNATLGTPVNGTITIIDNDGAPQLNFSVSNTNVSETAGSVVLTVQLSVASGLTVSVDYATSNGTAAAGADYQAATGTLTFNPGVTTQTVTVNITDDTVDEADETLNVALSNPGNAVIGGASATATILDDEATPTLQFTLGSSLAPENAGTINLTVSLSGLSSSTVTVDFATIAGTATAGSDFTTAGGTLSFAPGDLSKTVSVTIVNDPTNEAAETFDVVITNPVGALLGAVQSHTITIEPDTTDDPSIGGNNGGGGGGSGGGGCVAGAPASTIGLLLMPLLLGVAVYTRRRRCSR